MAVAKEERGAFAFFVIFLVVFFTALFGLITTYQPADCNTHETSPNCDEGKDDA